MTRALLALAGVLLFGAYLAQVVALGDWQVDDAGISFAYARHIAEGHGPVTNPGDVEVNEGWSNPVWTGLMALLWSAGLFHLVLTPKIVSGLCAAGSFWLLGRLVRQLGVGSATGWALVPMAALVANGGWVAWTVGGLENPQYVLTLLAALSVYLDDVEHPGRWPRSGPLFFLVAISRPEGLVYTVAAGTDALIRAVRTGSWRWLLQLVAGLLVGLVPYVVLHLAVFGDLLPNTYYAKSREGSLVERLLDPRAGGWRYLTEGLASFPQAGLLVLSGLAAADRAFWRRGGLAVVLALGASVLFVLQSGGDWMMEHRFLSPTYALVALLAAVGARTLGEVVWPTAVGRGVALGAAAIAVLAVASGLPQGLERIQQNPTVPLKDRLTRLPKLLVVSEALGLDHPTFLMSDMGGPMWANDQGQVRILDMFGLCDKHIAHGLHDRDVAALWSYGFEQHTPAMVQVPPTLTKSWRLLAYPHFLDAFTPLDDAGTPWEQVRWYLRRSLVEPAWEDAFATGDVVVQGALRVHRVTLVDSEPGEVIVEVVFSLRRVGMGRPRVRLSLVGERPSDAAADLLSFLDVRALTAQRVYVQRLVLAVPPDVGTVRSVQAIGTPEPSDLPAPASWQSMQLAIDGGGDNLRLREWVVHNPADVVRDGPRLVLQPFDPDHHTLCTPMLPAGRLRTQLTTRLRAVGEAATLDVRGYGPDGVFLGRQELWRWRTPHDDARTLHIEVAVPARSHTVRLCQAVLGGGTLVTEAWSVETLRDQR